ncbi:MAG: phytanoyl-CoA dioxygenase family protein [Planctomyces sp.]
MFDSKLKAQYDRDGYVVVRQLLSAEDFRDLQQELERYVREVVPTLPETAAFYVDRSRPETLKQMQHMQVDPFMCDYVNHPRWNALAECLVGESVSCDAPEWFNKPPGEDAPTPPHQDNYYFCLKPPNVVTLWMAMDRVDEANGCVRYIAGSHLRGIRPHGKSSVLGFSKGITDYSDADRAVEVLTDLQPGDVIAHHGNTIHRAEPNRSSSRHRRAFAMVFRGVSCQKDEEAYARYEADLRHQHDQLGIAR